MQSKWSNHIFFCITEALTLIRVMNENNVKNMIFSSSATVYSELPPEELPLTEDSPLGNCTCPYARYFKKHSICIIVVYLQDDHFFFHCSNLHLFYEMLSMPFCCWSLLAFMGFYRKTI